MVLTALHLRFGACDWVSCFSTLVSITCCELPTISAKIWVFSALVGVILACLAALSLAALAAPISASCTSDYIMLVRSCKTEIGKETIANVWKIYLESEMLNSVADFMASRYIFPSIPVIFFWLSRIWMHSWVFKSQPVNI
jgi:hypothetical protein